MQRRRVGEYELLGPLGRGGMGVVYRARDPSGREVALKLIHATHLDDRRRSRFKREAQALAKLRDPSILTVHAAGEHDGAPYLVCDLVEGRSLEEQLQVGPLPAARVLELGRALARALGHAHEAGVLHRDIKPDNIIIHADDGRPVLLDFGLSKLRGATGLTLSGQAAGTLGYAAPEQLQDASKVDQRADVYGLGATIYAMLTGGPPGAGLPPTEALVAALEGGFIPPTQLRPELDPGWDTLLARALAAAERRYPTVRALSDDLDALAAGRRLPSEPRGVSRWALALLAVVLTGAAGLAAQQAAGPGAVARAPSPSQTEAASPVAATTRQLAQTLPDWAKALVDLPQPLPATVEFTETPGVFRHVPSGIELVWVEPGETYLLREPLPRHVDGFFVGRTEVTRGEFRRSGIERPGGFGRFKHNYEGPEHPIVRVNLAEAEAFCEHFGLGLPSYAQWNRAAYAGRRAGYPWGTEAPRPDQANFGGDADGYAYSSPVGSFPGDVSPFGALDMAGSVREWVLGGPPGSLPRQGMAFKRGSSWKRDPSEALRHERGDEDPTIAFGESVGLRVVLVP